MNIENLIKENRDVFLSGQIVGNVQIIEYAGYELVSRYDVTKLGFRNKKEHYWKIKCMICNNERYMAERSILVIPKSCGCTKMQALNSNRHILKGAEVGSYKHGLSTSKLYNIHKKIKSRCYSPTDSSYHNFGAKGIKLCDEWLDSELGFENFRNWAISNRYSDDIPLYLLRKDNNGDYTPDNCYWSTDNPANGPIYTWEGVQYNVAEIANHYGLDRNRIRHRIDEGRTIEEAVLAPEWGTGKAGGNNRNAYINKYGEFKQKGAVCPFVFPEYPDINFNDPKLANCSVKALAKFKGVERVPDPKSEEDYRREREEAKIALINKLNNQ